MREGLRLFASGAILVSGIHYTLREDSVVPLFVAILQITVWLILAKLEERKD